jgi:hypothetical protein
MYIVMGIYLRPEALPGLVPQLSIWLIYAGLFILLFFHLRNFREMILPERIDSPIKFSWKILILLSLLFAIFSAASKFIVAPFKDIIMLIFWLIFGVIGISILFISAKDLFHKGSKKITRD